MLNGRGFHYAGWRVSGHRTFCITKARRAEQLINPPDCRWMDNRWCRDVPVHSRWAMDHWRIVYKFNPVVIPEAHRATSCSAFKPATFTHRRTQRLLPLCATKNFYRATRMHSADYAVAKCMSVRHTPVFCMNGYTYPKLFSPSSSPNILVFPYQTQCQHSDWTTSNPSFKVMLLFHAEYIRNVTRYKHSFNEIVIRTYTCHTQHCLFEWPRVT